MYFHKCYKLYTVESIFLHLKHTYSKKEMDHLFIFSSYIIYLPKKRAF